MNKKLSYKIEGGKVMQNIEEVYKQYSNTVYKYLFCLTGKEEIAEDLTQETFAIAIKQINKYRHISSRKRVLCI